MKLITKIAAAGALAVLIACGALSVAGEASAQQSSPTPSAAQTKRQQYRADFFAKLAANLNVSVDQLHSAFKSTELDLVDELQSDGTITPDQAAKMKERINSSNGFGLGALFGRFKAQQERVALRREIVKSAASAIGIDAKALVTELRADKSIADVAREHNVSLDTVKTQITNDVKSKLDQRVANGKLTQAKEDAALQKLANNLDSMLNKHEAQ